MNNRRKFAILVAVAAVALPACTHKPMKTVKGDASADSLPGADAPKVAPDATVDARASDPPEAGCNSEGALVLSRSAVDLGAPDVTSTGVATVTLTNTNQSTTGPVSVTASTGVTATGCSGPLAGCSSCTISITATPTTAGLFTGTVWISANPGAVTPLQVSVSAMVHTDLFSVAPASINLGNVAVGVPAPMQTVTVTAVMPITDLTVTSTGPDVAIDKAASTCATALAANASCTVVVSFVAAAAGSRTDAIFISGGGAAGKTVTVPITAVAQKPAQLVINPSTAQTFVASVGTTSSAITFGVANSGDLPTGAISVSITGPYAANFNATNTCTILAPLAACTVSVTWTPSAVIAIDETANLVVTDTATGGTSVTVPLGGWGRGGGVWLVIAPASGDLGSVLVGTTGPSTVFTVTNTGDTASGSLAVALSSTEFVITNDTCTGTSLAARTGTCTLSIALRPTTTGAKTATLTVAGTYGAPGVKPIIGVGVAPQALAASPLALDFGTTKLATTSSTQTVVITNTGSAPTDYLSVVSEGDSASFPIADYTCFAPLAPAAACTFSIYHFPSTAGRTTASYTLTDGVASITVTVSGTGVAQ